MPILVVLAINDFIMLVEDLAMACCGLATVSDVTLAVTKTMVKKYYDP
jgi:ABC-type maltose transport system permease subunit